MSKKLYISLIFNNLVASKTLSSNHRMNNLYAKFVKILEICKQFSENLYSTEFEDKAKIIQPTSGLQYKSIQLFLG